MTVHLKNGPVADVPATARIIDDPDERRAVMRRIIDTAWHQQELEAMVAHSPLIEVTSSASPPDPRRARGRPQPRHVPSARALGTTDSGPSNHPARLSPHLAAGDTARGRRAARTDCSSR